MDNEQGTPGRTAEDMLAEIVGRVREIELGGPDLKEIARLEDSAAVLDRVVDSISRLAEVAEELSHAANNVAGSKML